MTPTKKKISCGELSEIDNSNDETLNNNSLELNDNNNENVPTVILENDEESILDKWKLIFNKSLNFILEEYERMVLKKRIDLKINSDLLNNIWIVEKTNFIDKINKSFDDYIVQNNLSNNLEKFSAMKNNGLSKEIRYLIKPGKEFDEEYGEIHKKRVEEATEVVASLKSFLESEMTKIEERRANLVYKVENLEKLSKTMRKLADKYEEKIE